MTAPVLSRSFQPTKLRGVNADRRTVDIVASDFSLDSYGTRIDPAGWDLEQFKHNAVICLQHDSYSGLPVATAIPESIRIENGKLLMTVQFPPAGTSDDADEAFGLIAAGILRGVSVGFDPSEWEDKTEQLPDGSQITVRIYRKQRLMEVSFVTIPSNDNGLVVRARELNADPETIRKQTIGLEETLEKHQPEEPQVLVKKSVWDKYEGYFSRKQPANKASTKVLEKFFKARGEEQPKDEVEAWTRMGEILEEPQPEPKVETPVVEEVVVAETPVVEAKPVEETPPAPEQKIVEEPTPPTPPAPEAPEPERTASVQIPLSVLLELPGKIARAYAENAVEALRQGIPVKDALGMIDGMNHAVPPSISTLINASH
jgi:HK97 family phage prohead protease